MKRLSQLVIVLALFFGVGCAKNLTLSSTNASGIGTNLGGAAEASAKQAGNPDSYGSSLATSSLQMFDQLYQRGHLKVSPQEFQQIRGIQNASTCTATSSGTTTDADSDGAKVSVTYTFSCAGSDGDAGATVTASGTVKIEDSDDTAADTGFTVTITGFSFVVTLGSIVITAEISGTITIAVESGTVSITSTYSARAAVSGTNADSDVTIAWTGSMSITPDDADDPLAGGNFKIPSLSVTITFSGDSGTFTCNTGDDGLTYTQVGCSSSTGFTAGTLTCTDSGASTVAVTWSESSGTCSKAVALNGSTVSAVESDLP